jgi:hypothetical protein
VVASPAPRTEDAFEPAAPEDNRKLDRLLDKLGRLLERQRSADSAELDRRISRLVDRIRKLFTAQYGTAQSQSDPSTLVTVDYRRTESVQEVEATSVRAAGSVVTADGRRIDFTEALDLARAYARTSTTSLHLSATLGPGQSVTVQLPPDPAGSAAAVTPPTTGLLRIGDAALGFDQNGDGTIDPSTELLGSSGDGFAELARLDTDGNGFVDDGDPALRGLALVEGGTTSSLADQGIGAIYTGSVPTPYRLAGGSLSATGVYLNENGTTGFVRQVNLSA